MGRARTPRSMMGGTPSGAAGGDLAGTYPNPTVADLTIASEARGDLLMRGAASWGRLPPGTSGYALVSSGAGADLTWASMQATDAGLTSLLAADAAAGLPYVSAANTWTSLTLAANKGVYATSASALATYDLTASGRAIGGLTIAAGDLIQGTGAGTVAVLPAVATGNVLLSGGVGTVSAWGKVGLTTHVSGVLPAANGGTGNSQAVSGDVTLTTQINEATVTASCTITLPTVASWVIGIPTIIVWRSSTALTVAIAANAADKIEGVPAVAGYGHDVTLILTPVAANRWTCEAVRGDLQITTVYCDLTTAAGAGPTWTVANSSGGTSPVFTDSSTAGCSFAVSTGLVATSAINTSWYASSSATGAICTTPFSGLVDAWGRPITSRDCFWVLVKCSKTTTVASSTPSIDVGVGGAAVSNLPRVGSQAGGGGTMDYRAKDSGSPAAQSTSVSTITTAHWEGVLIDLTGDPMIRDAIHSSSPSGAPGSGWWPSTYAIGELSLGQSFWGNVWKKTSFTHAHFVMQLNATLGSKYTFSDFAIVRVVRGA